MIIKTLTKSSKYFSRLQNLNFIFPCNHLIKLIVWNLTEMTRETSLGIQININTTSTSSLLRLWGHQRHFPAVRSSEIDLWTNGASRSRCGCCGSGSCREGFNPVFVFDNIGVVGILLHFYFFGRQRSQDIYCWGLFLNIWNCRKWPKIWFKSYFSLFPIFKSTSLVHKIRNIK